jgi:endonuclease G
MGRGNSMGFWIRGFLMMVLLLLILLANWICPVVKAPIEEKSLSEDKDIIADYLPIHQEEGILVKHPYHTLWYSWEYGQPLWVAYELTVGHLERPKIGLSQDFAQDTSFVQKSVEVAEYNGSEFVLAQMTPALDRAWDSLVLRTTYLTSNVSPQDKKFNGEIWRELETKVREWVYDMGHLYVVSGPVLKDCSRASLDIHQSISIPCAFFKALLVIDDQGMGRSIAFLLPHPQADGPLDNYLVTIDSLEKRLGWDFFSGITKNEDAHEGRRNTEFWKKEKTPPEE